MKFRRLRANSSIEGDLQDRRAAALDHDAHRQRAAGQRQPGDAALALARQ